MRWFLLALWMPFAVQAEQVSEFVEANVLGIFYHEFGHAVIDIEGVPIFGQEEDAADVFSIYLIDAFYDEETAVSLAYDAAFGFLAEAEQAVADEVPWWDTHGPDEQRFYNTVCLFYGADPDGRKDFATDLELPEERAEFCPVEFDQANAAWGKVLDQMTARGAGNSISFRSGASKEAAQIAAVLKPEIDALNSGMKLKKTLLVAVEACDEANAFYDLERLEIVFCTEFLPHLAKLEAALE